MNLQTDCATHNTSMQKSHTHAITPNLKPGTLPRTHHRIIGEIQLNRNNTILSAALYPDATTSKRPQETEANGTNRQRGWVGVRTHEELVDAEAGVYGDDTAAVVLHPPLHRGSRRVLRQHLRQPLERATSTAAVTSRDQGQNCSGEPLNPWRRVP